MLRAAYFASALLLPLPLLAANEEAARRLVAETEAEAAAVQNMTVEAAIHILKNSAGVKPGFISFVQETLGSHHRHGHRHHHARHHLRQLAEPKGYAAVKSAVQKVSEQVDEVSKKWEEENMRCCRQHKAGTDELETMDQAIATANSQSSAAQGAILKANKKISEIESRIPDEKDALKELREKCAQEKISLEEKLHVTWDNLDGLDSMDMDQCGGKVDLLQCEHQETGESMLMVRHRAMKRSPLAQRAPAVQRLLRDVSGRGERLKERPVVFLQLSQHGDPHKCTMEANPECQQIRDRYMLMTSDLEDERDDIQEEQDNNDHDCEQGVSSAEANMDSAMTQLKNEQTALAEATADLNQAMETSRLKNDGRRQKVEEMTKEAKKCHDQKLSLVQEKNGYLKIRGEMLSMKGLKVFIQDCKVSAWTAGECSKTCGGGMLAKTRDVMLHPIGDGAGCPPLSVTEDCNTQRCPVDCKMGEWGGWSSCTAKCGGGVVERVRDIKRQGVHGGKPCGVTEETQTCNPQSCDTKCKLSRWSAWSACSKACDTGTTFKVRRVKVAASGSEKCPGKFSKRRMRMKTCHRHACIEKKDKGKGLTCTSKRDVVLLIDGSGSLRNSGWDAVKKVSAKIARAMGKDVQLSALLYSGPKDMKKYFKCTGQLWPKRRKGKSLGTPDMKKDCKIEWVQHFSSDKEKVAQKIEKMTWPRGSTLTSQALAMAETELSGGRNDAQAIVVVITDGKPMNKRKVTVAAKRLRKKARLMWLAVTKNAPIKLIQTWASVPVSENVIPVKNFKTLVAKDTLNNLIADMCPAVEMA